MGLRWIGVAGRGIGLAGRGLARRESIDFLPVHARMRMDFDLRVTQYSPTTPPPSEFPKTYCKIVNRKHILRADLESNLPVGLTFTRSFLLLPPNHPQCHLPQPQTL